MNDYMPSLTDYVIGVTNHGVEKQAYWKFYTGDTGENNTDRFLYYIMVDVGYIFHNEGRKYLDLTMT